MSFNSWIWVAPLLVAHALSASSACADARLEGTVVDLQGHLIVGARISLVCGDQVTNATTDSAGRFGVDRPHDLSGCVIAAEHSGFERVERLIAADPGAITLTLPLASLQETVTVEPERESEDNGVSAASFSGAALRRVSRDTEDLIRYAREVAGVPEGPATVYVDGLPSAVLPPAEVIDRLSVNQDFFSVERPDGQVQIDITTTKPARKVRFNVGGPSIVTSGGASALAPNSPPTSHTLTGSLSGPIPALPLTFSLDASRNKRSDLRPIEAVTLQSLQPGGIAAELASNTTDDLSAGLHCSTAGGVEVDLAFHGSYSRASNAGVGGLTLQSAGWEGTSHERALRLTIRKTAGSHLYRSGFLLSHYDSDVRANSTDMGVSVLGSFIGGGAALADSQAHQASWAWNNVLELDRDDRPGMIGFNISADAKVAFELPNPHGSAVFPDLSTYAAALEGVPTGSWFGLRGSGQAQRRTILVAPFAQRQVLRSGHTAIVVGLRGDYQSDTGTHVSPRVSLVSRVHSFVLRGGGGRFVHGLDNGVLVHAIEGDEQHLTRLFEPSVSVGSAGEDGVNLPITTRIGAPLQASADWILKGSVERTFGGLASGVEYTVRVASHLLGSRRIPAPDGWLDVLESNRRRHAQQLHVRLGRRWSENKSGLVFHYTWTRSFDDTGGPFFYAANPDNVQADWARSSGVSPHTASVVGNFNLASAFAMTVVATWHSSAPYDVTSGADASGNGLYNDRAGRPRNGGDGLGYQSFSVYGHRRLALPNLLTIAGKRSYVDVSVRADNIFDRANYGSVGSVVASPLFGRPLMALPGRSLRIGLSFDRQ